MDGLRLRFRRAYPGFELDIDLALPGRGVTALFGHSGSGKSTCLRCIAGLEKAAEGAVTINGETWQDSHRNLFVAPHRRALGYVFQDANLFRHLTVRRNLAFGLKRIAAAERRVELEQACALLGIEHLLERMPERLSGGEQQRVGIARALLTSPRLLLMDEPLASLDQKRKGEILPYLERLHEELDIPVLYVSHSPDEVARLADHLVLLENGKVRASGPIGETLARVDLPLALDDDAGVVIEGTVSDHDPAYGLLTLVLPGSALQMRVAHAPLALGKRLRFKVQARDVSLNLRDDAQSSILNRLPVRVLELVDTDTAAHVLVRLDAGGNPLLARITRYSRDQLQLRPGQLLWAQIKSVAVLA
ncbi:molybdenum ABC transporter ATP-binding protein [Pseudomonas aeruginosa]|uniref:molybdenum ABC transporter ATP-binding protein n=1 Tax=Pseudomonas aeruginosa TaxID=287 RepID=UPI000F528065|nr:molybdenum ABC transporter ATP-binding protein [Pseudomonas aeruginosa]MDA3275402.1 molybdenum ABC transporter ATP-binding protein [Pseudomonas aeruginosa]RPY44138.1 molybdenum ABC transporter ATP-binding protein [Pseudomonas aeruginosa]RPY46047.1 molybdenum ABC transporter ATP-binding protein [Pseudomonas aeruginosa]WCV88336.1 molybdenum ABC transporter ATP-binding protein [Pseudomonas aeruginosa]WCV93981.1 molybdenum ABC transporter ATP-binding protein [Pseudomonas aeruginosa]